MKSKPFFSSSINLKKNKSNEVLTKDVSVKAKKINNYSRNSIANKSYIKLQENKNVKLNVKFDIIKDNLLKTKKVHTRMSSIGMINYSQNVLSGNNSPNVNEKRQEIIQKTETIIGENTQEIKKNNLHNKSSSMSSFLNNSRNKLTNKNYPNMKEISSNSFFSKNFSFNNLLKNQFQQFNSNSIKIKKYSELNKKKINNSNLTNLKSPPEFKNVNNSQIELDALMKLKLKYSQSNSVHKKDGLNNSQINLSINNKKDKKKIPFDSMSQNKLKSTNSQHKTNYCSENESLPKPREFKLDSSVNIISSRLINEICELESNYNENRKSKQSNSTKESSIKSYIIPNTKYLDSATIEDMHIIFVKFYHQSRRIEKNLDQNEMNTNKNSEDNLAVIQMEERDL